MSTATDKLDAAIRAMPVVDCPISSLNLAWPEIGTHVLLGWAEAIERDRRLAAEEIAAAKADGPCEEGRVAVEHGYWRLGSARDRLATLTALATGVPTVEVRTHREILFRRTAHEHERRLKRRLNDLAAQGHAAAARLVQLIGECGARLLIRHQQSHGMAPILHASSLVWIECGHIKTPGGVFHYDAHRLIAKGALDENDLAPAALFERAVRLLSETYEMLEQMVDALARLITDAALPLPVPEVIWRVHETGEHFLDRQDAVAASRAAAGVAPVTASPAP